MTYEAVVSLMKTALILLALLQNSPQVPQDARDYATSVAHQAIAQATLLIALSPAPSAQTPINTTTSYSQPASVPAIALTQPTSATRITPGGNIPIAWSYTNAPQNTQVELELSLVQQTPGSSVSGVSGGTWQTSLISMGSGAGTYSWPTGYGHLDVPGTYSLQALLRQCDPQGCNYSSQSFTPAIFARSNTVNFTVGNAQSVVSYGTNPPITCMASASKQSVLSNETFTLSWQSSQAQYMTGLPTQDVWPTTGSQAFSVSVPGTHTYTMVFYGQNGLRETCSVTVYVSSGASINESSLTQRPNRAFTISGRSAKQSGTLNVVLYPASNVSAVTWQSVQPYTYTSDSGSALVQNGQWSATFTNGRSEGMQLIVLVFDSAQNNALVGQAAVTFTDKG